MELKISRTSCQLIFQRRKENLWHLWGGLGCSWMFWWRIYHFQQLWTSSLSLCRWNVPSWRSILWKEHSSSEKMLPWRWQGTLSWESYIGVERQQLIRLSQVRRWHCTSYFRYSNSRPKMWKSIINFCIWKMPIW